MAVLCVAIVALMSALYPTAVLLLPVVAVCNAFAPTATFPVLEVFAAKEL